MVRKRKTKMIIFTILGVLVAALLIFFLVVYFIFFRQDLNAARNRLASIQTEVYASQYGDIEYRLEGDNGPVILVAHGVTGGIDQGAFIISKFAAEGNYQFLYVSRFGYVNSFFPDNASANLQADAYKVLLDHLGIDRVLVYGNSAGGPSVMWFAIKYPERTIGLILQSTAAPTPEPVAAAPRLIFRYDFLYWAIVKAFPDMLIGLLLPEDLRSTLTPEERASLIRDAFLASLPISKRTEGIIFDNKVSTPSVNNIPFEQIQVPTLIFQATDDPREKYGGTILAERIPNNKYVGLTGGHFLLRQEERVQTEIDAFVGDLQ